MSRMWWTGLYGQPMPEPEPPEQLRIEQPRCPRCERVDVEQFGQLCGICRIAVYGPARAASHVNAPPASRGTAPPRKQLAPVELKKDPKDGIYK
jgi:hypothetical protein